MVRDCWSSIGSDGLYVIDEDEIPGVWLAFSVLDGTWSTRRSTIALKPTIRVFYETASVHILRDNHAGLRESQ